MLVSLHDKKSTTCLERNSYIFTVLSLSLSVLFGVVYLFSEVYVLHKTEGDLIERLSKHNEEEKSVEMFFQDEGPFYSKILCVFLIFAATSLSSLVWYSILMA